MYLKNIHGQWINATGQRRKDRQLPTPSVFNHAQLVL
jgi:hypothetical protein